MRSTASQFSSVRSVEAHAAVSASQISTDHCDRACACRPISRLQAIEFRAHSTSRQVFEPPASGASANIASNRSKSNDRSSSQSTGRGYAPARTGPIHESISGCSRSPKSGCCSFSLARRSATISQDGELRDNHATKLKISYSAISGCSLFHSGPRATSSSISARNTIVACA